MATFSLVPYSIRLRKKGEASQFLKLGKDHNSEKIDVLGFLQDYIENSIPNFKDLPEKIKADDPDIENIVTDKKIITTGLIAKENKVVSGVFRIGDHGYSAPLVNVKTGDVSHTKEIDEAELVPYYFLVKIIPTSNIGVVILQTFNSIGIKGVFFQGLNNAFRGKYPDFILELHPFVPKEAVREYLSSRIVEIRLVKHRYPDGVVNVSMDDMPDEDFVEGTCEMVIRPPMRQDFPPRFLNGVKRRIDAFLEEADGEVGSIIEVQNFTYDTAKIKVKHGEGYRTVDLGQTEKLNYSEELDGRVKIDTRTGYPIFASIDELGKSFLDDTATSIWGSNRDE